MKKQFKKDKMCNICGEMVSDYKVVNNGIYCPICIKCVLKDKFPIIYKNGIIF
jgi:formylmethanofuran dehydrogenase subunit E